MGTYELKKNIVIDKKLMAGFGLYTRLTAKLGNRIFYENC